MLKLKCKEVSDLSMQERTEPIRSLASALQSNIRVEINENATIMPQSCSKTVQVSPMLDKINSENGTFFC